MHISGRQNSPVMTCSKRPLWITRRLKCHARRRLTKQLDKLLAQFETIAKEYPSFPAGEMALLYSGHLLYKKGDFPAALDRYTKMQTTNLVKEGLGPLIFITLQ